MEGVLKGLQGKTLTKKKLFDFLSELNINDLRGKKDSSDNEDYAKIRVKEVDDIVERKECPETFNCEACKKSFATKSSLKRHHSRYTVCNDWIQLPKKSDVELTTGLHLVIEDLLQKSIGEGNSLECKYCKSTFSNRGNHHKHYNTATICNKMAFDEFKRLINNY